MRISDWSSDVCSSDLGLEELRRIGACPHLARTASHDPCQLPEPGRSVDRRLAEAALRPEMAGRTCWLRRDEQGVPIAIGTNVLHAKPVTARLALLPEPVLRAAVEGDQAGATGLLKGCKIGRAHV